MPVARVGLHVALPVELVRAVDGEARRQLLSRSAVVEQALRLGLAGRLARDLLRPVLDVDAEPEPEGPPDSHPYAETASGLPEADPRPAATRRQVTRSLPPGDPDRESPGGST